MCGICGLIRSGNKSDIQTLQIMNSAIRHRGPDDEGYYLKDNIGLAMSRLSIIDLETGHQPMFSSDKRMVIVFNGEIYNYRELKEKYLKDYTFITQSDTEVVLYLFHKMGKECFDFLHGIFAFAIYDSLTKELFIARDHIGVKPLYYYSDDHNFLFSSDILSFHQIPFIDLSINHGIIKEYLTYGYIPHPYSIFNKVSKLKPGHYAIINDKAEIRTYPYYKFWEQINPEVNIDFNYAKNKLRQLIHNSVTEQLVSDVPLGTFLSGGIDSSIVTVEMSSASAEPVNTFTIGFQGASNQKDIQLSSILASSLKLNHSERIIEPELDTVLESIINCMGEPFAITSAIPVYINSSIAREKVKVVLSGDGADEIFGGYGRYSNFFNLQKIDWLRYLPLSFFNDITRSVTGLFRSNKLNKAYLLRLYPYLSFLSQPDNFQRYLFFIGATEDKTISILMKEDVLQLKRVPSYTHDFLMFADQNGHNMNSLMAFDVKTSLVDEMLTKVDFASMLASLEVRVPFLDHRLVEYGLSLPAEFKISRSTNKRILREAYLDRLPSEIINAPKRGFNLPLDNWIKNNWSAQFKSIFNSPLLNELGIDRTSLTHLFDKYLAGFPINGKIFYYIFILVSWYEKLKLKMNINAV